MDDVKCRRPWLPKKATGDAELRTRVCLVFWACWTRLPVVVRLLSALSPIQHFSFAADTSADSSPASLRKQWTTVLICTTLFSPEIQLLRHLHPSTSPSRPPSTFPTTRPQILLIPCFKIYPLQHNPSTRRLIPQSVSLTLPTVIMIRPESRLLCL